MEGKISGNWPVFAALSSVIEKQCGVGRQHSMGRQALEHLCDIGQLAHSLLFLLWALYGLYLGACNSVVIGQLSQAVPTFSCLFPSYEK